MVSAIKAFLVIQEFQLGALPEAEQSKLKEAMKEVFTRRVLGVSEVGFEVFPYNGLIETTLKPPADGWFSKGESELLERSTSRATRLEIAKALGVASSRVCPITATVTRV